MDIVSNKTLAEAIQAVESGVSLNTAIARYPAEAEGLRSHLGLWQRLEAAPRVDAANSAMNGGRTLVLELLAGPPGATFKGAHSTFSRAAAAAVGFMVLGASAAGASAALGGPDFAGRAFESVGITSSHNETGDSDEISSDATDVSDAESQDGAAENSHPNENANENAFEGCENREDGRNNASDNATNGDAEANPRAFEGGDGNEGKCIETGQGSSGDPDNNAGGNPDNNAGGNPDNNAGGNPDNNGGGNPDNNAGGSANQPKPTPKGGPKP